MIYCTNCGSENYDDSRFCSHCGFTIEKRSLPPKQVVFVSKEELVDQPVRFDPPTPSPASNSTSTYVVREERGGHSSKWIGVSLICVGIFLMIMLLLPIFFMAYVGDYSTFGEVGGTFGLMGGDIGSFFGELGSKIGQFFGGIGDDFDVDMHHGHEYSSNTRWIIVGLLFRLFFVGILVAIAIAIIMKTRARRVQTN